MTHKASGFLPPSEWTNKLNTDFGMDDSILKSAEEEIELDKQTITNFSAIDQRLVIPNAKSHAKKDDSSDSFDSVSDLLRFSCHVFLDHKIKESSLEGFLLSKACEILTDFLSEGDLPPFIRAKAICALEDLQNIDSLFVQDESITKDSFLEEIKRALLQAKSSFPLPEKDRKNLEIIIKSSSFHEHLSPLIEQTQINSSVIHKNQYSLILKVKAIVTGLLDDESFIEKEKISISDDRNAFLKTYIESCNFFTPLCNNIYGAEWRKKNLPAAQFIKNKLQKLKQGQSLYIPTGYTGFKKGHTMILILEKNEDETVNMRLINTGAGTQHHDRCTITQNLLYRHTIHSKQAVEVIDRVMYFAHVPLDHILVELNEEPVFLQMLIDMQTLPFILFQIDQSRVKAAADMYYKVFESYFGAYRSSPDDLSLHAFSTPQVSGTCVWNSLDTILFFLMPSQEAYQKLSSQLKMHLLVSCYEELCIQAEKSSNQIEQQALLLLDCSKQLIVQMEHKLCSMMQIPDFDLRALSSAIDIKQRIEKFLITCSGNQIVSSLDKPEIDKRQRATDNQIRFLNFLSEKISPPDKINDHKVDLQSLIKDTLPQVQLSHGKDPAQIENDIEQIATNLLGANPIDEYRMIQYLDALRLSADLFSSVRSPQKCLENLQKISSSNTIRISSKDPYTLFIRRWKLFLLGVDLCAKICPIIKNYPLDSFGLSNKDKRIDFQICENIIKENLFNLLQTIEEHNQKITERYDHPLFHKINNVRLDLDKNTQRPKSRDATFDFYEKLIDSSSTLKAEVNKKSADHLPAMRCAPLYEDFDEKKGILQRSGLAHITLLKTLFLSCYLQYPKCKQTTTIWNSKAFIENDILSFGLLLNKEKSENSYDLPKAFQERQWQDLRWSSIPKTEWEIFFIKNKRNILKKISDYELSEAACDLVIDLLIASSDRALLTDRLFTLLLKEKNEDCLNEHLIQSLFESILFNLYPFIDNEHPLFDVLKKNEALRSQASHFFYHEWNNYLDPTREIADERIHTVLDAAVHIQREIAPIPFLFELPCKFERLPEKRKEILSSYSLQLKILSIKEDNVSDEDVIDLIQKNLQVKDLSEEEQLSFLLLIPKIAQSLQNPRILDQIKNQALEFLDLRQKSQDLQGITYDAHNNFLWMEFKEKKIGIHLASHFKVEQHKDNTYWNESRAVTSNFVRDLLISHLIKFFPDLANKEYQDQLWLSSQVGEFYARLKNKESEEEVDDEQDLLITYTPSLEIQNILPDLYKGAEWNHVTEYLVAMSSWPYDRLHNIDEDLIKEDFYMELSSLETGPAQILSMLPFEKENILFFYALKLQDRYAILTTNKDHAPSYLVEVEHTTKNIILTNLSNHEQFLSLDKECVIRKKLPGIKSSYVESEEESYLSILDVHGRNIHLQKSGNKFIFEDDQIYQLNPYHEPIKRFPEKHLIFQSEEHREDIFILMSFHVRDTICCPSNKNDDEIEYNSHLLCYKIQKGRTIPISAKDKIVLALLKIKADASDRWHAISMLQQIPRSEVSSFGTQELIRGTLLHITENFEKAWLKKDEYSLLAAYLLNLINDAPFLIPHTLPNWYRYYKNKACIPQTHLIPLEIEKKILKDFFGSDINQIFEHELALAKNIECSPKAYISSTPTISIVNLLEEIENDKISSETIHAVTIDQIIESLRALDKKKIQAIIFCLIEQMHLGSPSNILLAKLCLCMEPSILLNLNINITKDGKEILTELLQKKNLSYLNQILENWFQFQQNIQTRKIDVSFSQRLIGPEPIKEVQFFPKHSIGKTGVLFGKSNQIMFKALALSRFHTQIQNINQLALSILHSINSFDATKDLKTLKIASIDPSVSLAVSIPPLPLEETSLSPRAVDVISLKDTYHHLGVFLSSLHQIIEKKTSRLLTLFSSLQEAKDASLTPFLKQAAQHSQKNDTIHFDDLIYALVDGSSNAYHSVNLPEYRIQNAQVQLNHPLIDAIHQEIGDVLLLKIWQRRWRPYEEAIKEQRRELLFSLLSEPQALSMQYSEKTLHWLAFEYLTGWDIREKQRKLLDHFEEKREVTISGITKSKITNQVAQLMMGEGKSSVLLPLLSYSSTKENQISLVICLKAQMPILIDSLRRSQTMLFNQKVIAIDLKRSDLNDEKLRNLYYDLRDAQQNRSIFVATAESIQALELEYIQTQIDKLPNDIQRQTRTWLSEILLLLQTNGNCIIDEFAHIADIRKITNFPLFQTDQDHRDQVQIPKEHIDFMSELFSHLLSNKTSASEKICLNEQIYLTAEDYKEIYASTRSWISHYFLSHYPSFVDKASIEHFLTMAKINRETSEYLQAHPDQKTCQLLCLAHLCLHSLLPKVLKQCGGRNYGRSIEKNKREKIIPYQGVGSPSTTEFGFPYEAIAYHLLYASQFGMETAQIHSIAQWFKEKAEVNAKRQRISVDQTQEGTRFFMLTAIRLSEYKKNSSLTIKAKLDNERACRQFHNLLCLEAISAFRQTQVFPVYLSSTPYDFFEQFQSVRGLTGTPWNHLTYSQKLFSAKGIHLDREVEDRIDKAFCEKKNVAGIDHFAFIARNNNPSELLESLFSKIAVDEKKHVRAIVDTGGLFKEKQNQEIASAILSVLQQHYPEANKLNILFFSKNENHPLPDVPYILEWDATKKRERTFEVKDFSLATLASQNILETPYFIYYDERHSVGTDIALPEEAIGLITIDGKTPLYQFNQGLLRARRYLTTQRMITIIPHNMLEIHEHANDSPEALVTILKNNEKALLTAQIKRAYQMQIETIMKRIILDHLLRQAPFQTQNNDAIHPLEVFNVFKSLFQKKQNLDLIDLISETSQTNSLEELIKKEYSKIINHLIKLKLKRTISLFSSETKKIFDHARTNSAHFANASNDELLCDVLVEQNLEQLQEQNLEQELDQELEEEIVSLQNTSFQSLKADQNMPLNEIIPHFELFTESFKTSSFSVEKLSCLESKDISSCYSIAFQSIYVSNHTISNSEDLFNIQKKKLVSLFVIQSILDNTPSILALTHGETEQVSAYLKENSKDNCFLINSEGHLIIDSYSSSSLDDHNSAIEDALVEINIFNNNLQDLAKLTPAMYRWLNPADKRLSAIRERLLIILSSLCQEENFRSMIPSFKSGEMVDLKGAKQAIATELIEKAVRAHHENDDVIAASTLSDYPEEMLHLLPDYLCQYVSKRFFSKLKKQEQIRSLSLKDCTFLNKSQICKLDPNRIEQIIQLGRSDLNLEHITILQRPVRESEIAQIFNKLQSPECEPIELIIQSLMESRRRSSSNSDDEPLQLKRARSSSPAPQPLHASNIAKSPRLSEPKRRSSQIDDMDLIGAKRPCLLQAIAPSGFINLGNTCYLNASLKAIFNQPLLCSLIERRATTGDALIEKLDAILSLYRQEEDASDALASVFSDPQVISWGYHVGPEFDADELCRRLFSLLGVSDELSASIHVSDEPATSILPLHPESENPFSIQELIDLQLRERLIHLYPQALSFLGIQIARFQGRGRKNYAPLIDPLAPIVLSVVTPENPPVTSTVTLAPSSFICHRGTLNSGHYITITKDGENNYLVHDDLHVYSITEQKAQELASKHAYIIFYSV